MLITATTRTADRTGVEMEALTAVSVAALTLIDMVKAVDPAAVITDVRVEEKAGGKTGRWTRPTWALAERGPAVIRALAITVSNRASAGVYADRSGPVLAGLLAEAGATRWTARGWCRTASRCSRRCGRRLASGTTSS